MLDIIHTLDHPLRLIVAGGRDFTDAHRMVIFLNKLDLPPDTELVCGHARGADSTALLLWNQVGNKVHSFRPQWRNFGRSAGFRRNAEMARFGDALVAYWDGQSRGTKHMIDEMNRLNKPTFIYRY